MRLFELIEPRSIEEACEFLAENKEARPIAGGTALLILIKHGVYVPKTLVNLKKVSGASEITYDTYRGLRIGALASIYDVETAPFVRQYYPILSQTCHLVANVRIRNMATIGGNLAHADYQSDPPAALIALDASVELASHQRTREVKLTDFLCGSYETTLEPGELLSALLVPPAPRDLRGTYLKFTTRSSEDRPCAGVSAMVRLEDGVCSELRLVVGAVSPRPVQIQSAGELARGERLNPSLIEELAARAADGVDPIDDLRGPADYKRHLVHVLVRRALMACAAS